MHPLRLIQAAWMEVYDSDMDMQSLSTLTLYYLHNEL